MMKLFVFIAVVAYFTQVCLAAPRAITDHDVERVNSYLDDIFVDLDVIDRIVATLEKYPKTSRIVSLALQGDTCTKNNIDVMHIIAIANDKSDAEIHAKYNRGEIQFITNFTNDQLKKIEDDLKKNHSSEKVQKAMQILRGFQKHASRDEADSSLVEFLTAAAEADSNGCQSE